MSTNRAWASHAIIDSMTAQLIVRNLDPEIVARLRRRAAQHGRSVEAEHREILREALLPARGGATFKDHLLAMPDAGADEDFARVPGTVRRVKL
jgi:antitoxin FitA